jgi:hypothetical protein
VANPSHHALKHELKRIVLTPDASKVAGKIGSKQSCNQTHITGKTRPRKGEGTPENLAHGGCW